MDSVLKLMPNPRELARDFTNPFIYVLGGCALFLAVMYVMVGEDPSVPVTRFLSQSVVALLPLATSLLALWLCYLVVYLLLSAYICDLWIVARLPDWIAGFLMRCCSSIQHSSALPVCLVFPPSLVRRFGPYLSFGMVTGWRAGDSVQLE